MVVCNTSTQHFFYLIYSYWYTIHFCQYPFFITGVINVDEDKKYLFQNYFYVDWNNIFFYKDIFIFIFYTIQYTWELVVSVSRIYYSAHIRNFCVCTLILQIFCRIQYTWERVVSVSRIYYSAHIWNFCVYTLQFYRFSTKTQ